MDDLTTKRRFDSQATWVINVLGLFYDMLFMVVCTSRHSHMPGRLVQELNVCTVDPRHCMTDLDNWIEEVGYIHISNLCKLSFVLETFMRVTLQQYTLY